MADKMHHENMDKENQMKMNHSGMDHDSMDHGGMTGMAHMGNLKRKFWVSLALTVPIIVLSPMMGMSLPFQFSFPGSDYLVLILATILFFYGGTPFLFGARDEFREKSPGMMALIALGITVAYVYSLYAFVMNHFVNPTGHIMDFFWELATLIVIMLLGHRIEMDAMMNAGSALQSMAALLPASAKRLTAGGQTEEVALSEVMQGDELLVGAGEKIPADGEIVAGTTTVNEAMVTGESRQVTKETGDTVIGGSLNGSGSITLRVTGTGESGYIAQVTKLISDAQAAKSHSETLADKVAKWLFYIAGSVGIIAFFAWLAVSHSVDTALSRMVTVLVIACPHALGLAISLVVARSTSIAATGGLLIRRRDALELADKIDRVMMDKTGTLTEGDFKVREIVVFDEATEDEVLATAAALEQSSSHPLAQSIVAAAQERKLTLPPVSDVQNIAGAGLTGKDSDGRTIQIVSAAYLDEHRIDYDLDKVIPLLSQGYTLSLLVVAGKVVGALAQGDELKYDAVATVMALKELGVEPVMLTGDNPQAALAVAERLGISQFHAALKPEDKAAIIKQERDAGHRVMMVGDGVNDAPSLAAADIGCAIGAGTDVAIDTADVVLVKSDPGDILHFLDLARATQKKMKQNLWWGAGYNIFAIPLAAGVLAPIGIILSPAVGAILMSLSTVVVAINAMTLKMKH